MKNQKNSKGFTLVEVLIAVSILAIAVIPLLANFVLSSKVNVKSKRTLNGTMVAQNIMEGISAFGVESTIVQLEDQTASPIKLRFMPEGMEVGNWGRASFATTTSTVSDPITGKDVTVTVPKTYQDRYQDDDEADEIAMVAKESTMFSDEKHGTVTSTMKYAYEKDERDGTKKVYFKQDASHAYMFWMENVSYGNKKYDVLLTMDANPYRKDGELDLFDTTQNVSSYTRGEIQSKMNDSADSFSKDRNYNSLNLTKIASSIGTNVAADDEVPDRYFTEPANYMGDALQYFLNRSNDGVTEEDIQKKIERTMNILIYQEANPVDSSKAIWIIKIEYDYVLTDTSLLRVDGNTHHEEQVVYRSSQYPPRNLFFYYLPNYAPTDAGGTAAMDKIHIKNVGGEEASGGSGSLGTETNVYLVRMCDSTSAGDTSLANSEDRYKVEISLEEQIENDEIRTRIYTNTEYNLKDDSRVTDAMGTYYLNGMHATPAEMEIKSLSGAAYSSTGADAINEDDYIYRVTVQVFREGSKFQKAARIAKFSSSSN